MATRLREIPDFDSFAGDLGARAAAIGVTLTPLTASIGAEIAGLDLERPLSVAAAELLRDTDVGQSLERPAA